MQARTVFISDVHLGHRLSQYEKLLAFLKSFEFEDGTYYNLDTLYLVGDIIDIIQFDAKLFWSKHRVVLKKLLRMADKGVKIIYIPGNHEQPFRNDFFQQDLYDLNLNGIEIKHETIHVGVDGKRYLISHGDEHDGWIRTNPFLYKLGDFGYEIMNRINQIQNLVRKLVGLPEWSFSLWVKTNFKKAIKFINNFEQLVVDRANTYKVDGVVNGHIHQLSDKMIDGVRYLNSGCWVEFCSYIIEYENGQIEAKYYE